MNYYYEEIVIGLCLIFAIFLVVGLKYNLFF